MTYLLGALLIFVLRICDVTIGTLRVLFAVRGRRIISSILGALEAGIWLTAIQFILKRQEGNPFAIVGYMAGFAAGTALGITLEQLFAGGSVLVRIISREHSRSLLETLRSAHFGVTAVEGEGGTKMLLTNKESGG